MADWKPHFYRIGPRTVEFDDAPTSAESFRKQIEPWLTALFQSEHLSLLLGNGFTTAVAASMDVSAASMESITFSSSFASRIDTKARDEASCLGRGRPNIEDQLRVALRLLGGLEVLEDEGTAILKTDLNNILCYFLNSILDAEIAIANSPLISSGQDILQSFLLSFASRTASRDRLHIFTTNYDRLIEYGCDLTGLHVIDRFVGNLYPIFRSSRLSLDVHYNPPGIRGEPRYLEGVVRLTKLHGSLDWRWEERMLRKVPLPFGATKENANFPSNPLDSVMIYPNPAKDVETLSFPYADLFRDFSAALCRPNSVLVTYGYGFGDDHINRVLQDMLTLPSTHLVILSYDDSNGRIRTFCEKVGHAAQITLLIGNHFGDITQLTDSYLPKPSIDFVSIRQAELIKRRSQHGEPEVAQGDRNVLPD